MLSDEVAAEFAEAADLGTEWFGYTVLHPFAPIDHGQRNLQRRAQRASRRVSHTCAQCGKPVRYRFCSVKCHNAWWRWSRRETRLPKRPVAKMLLEALSRAPAPVSALRGVYPDMSRGTIETTLYRLEKKGLVRSEGRPRVFRLTGG